MPLWGNRDFVSGNNKPKWANTADVYGANVGEVGLAGNAGKGVAPGWVQVKRGTGGISSIQIVHPGGGYNANGYLIVTGGGQIAGGTPANISFFAKSNNANASDNTVIQVVINNPGSGYANTPTLTANLSNSNAATFRATMGGRANRFTVENLVTVNDISGSSNAFPNMA